MQNIFKYSLTAVAMFGLLAVPFTALPKADVLPNVAIQGRLFYNQNDNIYFDRAERSTDNASLYPTGEVEIRLYTNDGDDADTNWDVAYDADGQSVALLSTRYGNNGDLYTANMSDSWYGQYRLRMTATERMEYYLCAQTLDGAAATQMERNSTPVDTNGETIMVDHRNEVVTYGLNQLVDNHSGATDEVAMCWKVVILPEYAAGSRVTEIKKLDFSYDRMAAAS